MARGNLGASSTFFPGHVWMHRIGRCIGRLGRLFGQRSWMSEPGEQTPKRIKLDAQDVLPPPAHDKMPRFDRGVFLAPMVRSGALPCRLLALEYGADLVLSLIHI